MIRARTDRLVLIAATLATLIYLAASGDAVSMLPVLMGLLGARLITGRVGSGRNLPSGVITLAVLGVMGVILAVALTLGFNIELFSRLIALLMTLKAFERRTARDLSQVLMLAVFLLIGALLTDSGMLVGLGLLVMVPVVVVAAMQLQLLIAVERASVPDGRIDARARRSFRRTAGLVTVLGLLGSVVMFLVIPRGLAEQVFGSLGRVSLGEASTGFDDEIDLDLGGVINESPNPVLDLLVTRADGKRLGGDGQNFYLRGAVLDVYENRKWKSSPNASEERSGFDANKLSTFASSARSRGMQNQWTMEQRVILRNVQPDSPYLFGSWEPMKIEFEQPTTIRTRRDVGTARFESAQGKVIYTLRVRDVLAEEDLGRLADRERRDTTVTFPSQAVHDYAVSLLEDAQVEADPMLRSVADDRRVARVFENHLRQQFGYTLTPTRPGDAEDPIEWFLYEHKEGHCEVFASAMAALCRSVGINARVVTGYLATEFNDLTGYYVVRESNAHAWVEVQVVPGDGLILPGSDPGVWLTYDPTPPIELQSVHDPKPGLATRIKHLYETAEFAWINSVVGFGAEKQKSVIGTVQLPRWLQDLDKRAEQRVTEGRQRLIAVSFGLGVAAFAASVLLLTLLKLALATLAGRVELPRLRFGLRRRRRRGGRLHAPGLDRPYAMLLQSLAKRGVPKPAEVPLRRHVLGLNGDLEPGTRAAYEQAASILYEAEFSSRELTPDRLGELKRAVREAASGA